MLADLLSAAFDQFVDPKRLVNIDVQSNRNNPKLRHLSVLEILDMIESCDSVEKVRRRAYIY